MKVTYYGHACLGVEIKGVHLLFDPFITPNDKAKAIDIQSVPADYILISHGHGDHVADVEVIAKRTGAKVISNYEIVSWFEKKGIKNNHPMNHGGQWKFDFGTVKYVNAVHSSTLPDGSSGGNPGGFVISTDEGDFYFSGDTALTYDMKLIGALYDLKFAMLCLGDNFTMGVEDAAVAAEFIQCDTIIGMHYDTFGFIVINHEKAIETFREKEKQLHLLKIGETLTID
ncbi:MAG: metal-dependent hydrolase [Bacteroidia bacterium]|nr:metal-dependent hydrolase [Bacteroidia bacterium]